MFPGLRASVGHPDQAPWRARGGASSAAPDIDHSNREGRNETGDGNPGMSAIRSPTSPYRTCSKGQLSALLDKQAMSATLSSNQLLTTVLSQHRFHFIQSIDGGAHLRLIYYARCLCIGDLAPKIHLHLTLFLGDDGLNDGRGFLWNAVSLS